MCCTSYCQNVSDYLAKASKSLEIDDYQGAIVSLTEAIELDSSRYEAFGLRGTCKTILGDYRGSIPDFDQVIRILSSLANIGLVSLGEKEILANSYAERGLCKSQLSNHLGAISDFTQAIELDDKQALFYFVRGLSRIKNNQKELGCLDFSKAGELGHQDAYEAIRKYCN